MDWAVATPSGESLLNVAVGEAFLAWVRARTSRPDLMIDPYRDVTLDREAELFWRDELTRIAAEHRAAVEQRLVASAGLPAEEAARARVLGVLVERELTRTAEWQTAG
jgi:hypothetical protein